MAQAITVKVLAPTNTKGKRLKASTTAGDSKTIPWRDSDEAPANYARAVRALCFKMQWTGLLHGGDTKEGMVFVFDGPDAYVRVDGIERI